MRIAITRGVSAAIGRCELAHLPRVPIDVGLAREQHRAYERLLSRLGCRVQPIPASSGLPDSVFVEDIAIVVDELAILTRPGAEPRRLETPAVADRLREYRRLESIEEPGTLDGGDVIADGRNVFVGRSRRTNDDGIAQLQRHLDPYGYQVRPVDVHGCLHLKSAATPVDEGLMLVNPEWVPPQAFDDYDRLEVDPAEPYAANTLRIGRSLVYADAYPRTRARLERRGLIVHPVDVSELAKAEGAVTCCSLIFAPLPAGV
jgi:dimethylargininase